MQAEAATAALAVASKLGPGDDEAVNVAMNRVVKTAQDASLRDQARRMIRGPRPPVNDKSK